MLSALILTGLCSRLRERKWTTIFAVEQEKISTPITRLEDSHRRGFYAKRMTRSSIVGNKRKLSRQRGILEGP